MPCILSLGDGLIRSSCSRVKIDLCPMPDRWLFLTGAPTLQQLQDASSLQAYDTGASRWHDLRSPSTGSALPDREQEADDEVQETQEASSQVQAVLFEKSRLVVDESYRRKSSVSLAVPAAAAAGGRPPRDESQESTQLDYSESLLPPATQRRGDGTVNQTTIEESLVNLPSWSFSLSSITRLDALATAHSGAGVNLLALISDLDPPTSIPLKKPSRMGKLQAVRASLSLIETSGATLDVVMWDDIAEKWAGEALMSGDVVYLEKIALSEYRGKRQGSAIVGSKVQICYRTVETGRKEDKALRPDLGLGWDQASVRVKALVDLAAGLG